MSGHCPAGQIPCEHFKADTNDANYEKGRCHADIKWKGIAGIARVILKTDTQCPCPQLQKKVADKFDRVINILGREGWGIDKADRDILIKAFKEAGLKNGSA